VPVVRFDLFSSGRLRDALEEAGYPGTPPPRTLRSWIQNDSAPESLRAYVSEVLLERKEAAPPWWAERLQQRLDEIYESQQRLAQSASRDVIEALAPDELRQAASEADARIAAELEASRRRSAGRDVGPTVGRAGESPGSKRRMP
jgi:hypothetical protein